jgi:hypothetical protein
MSDTCLLQADGKSFAGTLAPVALCQLAAESGVADSLNGAGHPSAALLAQDCGAQK